MDGVDAAHSSDVPKDDFVWTDTNNRTVDFEKVLDCLALLKTEDVCSKPKVGDGGVPRAGDSAKGRPEEIVYYTNGEVGKWGGGGGEKKGGRKDRGEHNAKESGYRGRKKRVEGERDDELRCLYSSKCTLTNLDCRGCHSASRLSYTERQ